MVIWSDTYFLGFSKFNAKSSFNGPSKNGDPLGLYEVSSFGTVNIVVVQLLSRVWLFVTPWMAICQASLSFIISWSLLKLMSIESMMPSNHLILCHPLLLLPLIFPRIRVFSNESSLFPASESFSMSHSKCSVYNLFPHGVYSLEGNIDFKQKFWKY